MSVNCPTQLLNDLPADLDAFGSHQRVAEAIAELVTKEEGGKAIALTGTWGSGKSTVVRLLQSYLRRQKNHAQRAEIFVYDAWVHQGDPLRRSFLEALIAFLASPQVGWTDRQAWQNDLDRLSRRREETDTKSSPVLTSAGKLMATSVLLLPLGYTLFATISSDLRLAVPVLGIPFWVVGLVLSLLPFFVACIVWLSWRSTWRVWSSEFWTKHRAPHENDSVLAFFVHETQTVNRSKTIRTPEPTSIEFREIFERVLAAVLGLEDRRLVVVMDNLDRVPPEEALAVWSTMRAFFDVSPDTPGNAGWLHKFWLLVPFDPGALRGLWGQRLRRDDQSPSGQEGQANEAANERSKGDFASKQKQGSEEGRTVAAFVDKSFQIEFRVPPPVLSRWKKFFLEQFGKAFPEHADGKDGDDVYRLFRRIGLPEARPLAPRDIKLFINKLGSLHRQWKDEIPLLMQALYALYANRLSDPERDLVRTDFLNPVVEGLVDGRDWRRHLAALHFNVSPDDAYQVLIGREVEESLRNGDVERFSKLVNIPAVATVCDHVLEENWKDWATSDPSALAHSALVLDEVGCRDSVWTVSWSWLAKGLELVKDWNGLDERTGKGIAAVLSRTPAYSRERTAQSVMKAIRKDSNLAGTEESEPSEEAIENWVDGALEVVRYLDKTGLGDLLRDEFRVPGTAGAYIVALRHLGERPVGDAPLHYFVPEIERQGVVEELARINSAGEFSDADIRTIYVMLDVGGQWPWDALLSAINQRLQAANALTTDELVASLEALLTLKKGGIQQAEEALERLCRLGHLMHHLHAVRNQPQIAAFPILAYLVALPGGTIQAAPGNASAGGQFYQSLVANPAGSPELVTELAKLCVRLRMPRAAVTAYKEANGLEKLAAAILGEIVNQPDVGLQLPSDYVVAEWDAICSLLDDEQLKALVAALVQRGDLADRLVSEPPDLEDGRLYFLAYDQASSKDRQRLANVLMPMLRAVGKDAWLGELDREGYLVRLVVTLVEHGETLALGAQFHDALLDHAKKMINSSQAAPEHLVSKWHSLPQALDQDRRNTFARNLWDELANNASSSSLATFFKLYGKYLLSTGPADPDEVMRRVCSPIMGRGEPEEIAWVADLLEKQGNCWKEADAATQRDFQGRVEAKLRECDNDGLGPSVERIARAIGLSPEKIIEDSKNGGEPRRGEEE